MAEKGIKRSFEFLVNNAKKKRDSKEGERWGLGKII
jgi:hypothetical protein